METTDGTKTESTEIPTITHSPIEDNYLRRVLIDTSVAIEKQIEDGIRTIDDAIESRIKHPITEEELGLLIIVSMVQARPDKPIIFKYSYRVERATFQKWVANHWYMMENVAMFQCRGINFAIPGPGAEKYHETSFSIVVRYDEQADVLASLDLLNETVEFIVHREIVNPNDWLIKAELNEE